MNAKIGYDPQLVSMMKKNGRKIGILSRSDGLFGLAFLNFPSPPQGEHDHLELFVCDRDFLETLLADIAQALTDTTKVGVA